MGLGPVFPLTSTPSSMARPSERTRKWRPLCGLAEPVNLVPAPPLGGIRAHLHHQLLHGPLSLTVCLFVSNIIICCRRQRTLPPSTLAFALGPSADCPFDRCTASANNTLMYPGSGWSMRATWPSLLAFSARLVPPLWVRTLTQAQKRTWQWKVRTHPLHCH